MHFFTEGSVIMDYGFIGLKLKHLNDGYVSAFVFSRC